MTEFTQVNRKEAFEVVDAAFSRGRVHVMLCSPDWARFAQWTRKKRRQMKVELLDLPGKFLVWLEDSGELQYQIQAMAFDELGQRSGQMVVQSLDKWIRSGGRNLDLSELS